MKRIICIISALLIALSLFSCGSKKNDITGKWEASADYDGESVSLSYEFFEDGTGRYEMDGFSADKFTYELSGNTIVLTVGSESSEIPFSVEKDTLILEIEGQSIRLGKVEE